MNPPETVLIGTASEVISYLQQHGNGTHYRLTTIDLIEHILDSDGPLTIEEEELLLDEMGEIGKGRLDPNLRYDREDIYFDRY